MKNKGCSSKMILQGVSHMKMLGMFVGKFELTP